MNIFDHFREHHVISPFRTLTPPKQSDLTYSVVTTADHIPGLDPNMRQLSNLWQYLALFVVWFI